MREELENVNAELVNQFLVCERFPSHHEITWIKDERAIDVIAVDIMTVIQKTSDTFQHTHLVRNSAKVSLSGLYPNCFWNTEGILHSNGICLNKAIARNCV